MDPKEVNERLTYYVRPQSFPIAAKLITSEEELPKKAKIPSRDLGHQILVCQGVGMARRYGWTLALGKDDVSCAPAAAGLGFVHPEELRPPEETSFGLLDGKLEYDEFRYLLISPIHSKAFEPDSLILYGNSAQVMRLVQSFTVAGKEVDAIATAFRDCVDIAVVKENTNPQVILPSGGDRVFGGTQDFEMIFALPWDMVGELLKGLETTHQMGLRYPVLTYLRYKPELPPFLDLEKMKGQA